ncbi:hypothetical protein PSCLAVI8L_130430 [Pseudoclavibacter sp. 8L]|nr:hypothetical protein PSCLAVI8L_130430 [Pseudoclavibacter sp. 8L]
MLLTYYYGSSGTYLPVMREYSYGNCDL